MRCYVGTSGFSYPAWRGRFYPEDLPAARWLSFYARHFEAVELNNSFYRMPTPAQLARWASETPSGFRFALKATRRITHVARLSGASDLVGVFLRFASELGAQLGPVLFQLPPSLRSDPPLLADFLETLPDGLPAAFEFRNPSWIRDDRIPALLSDHAKALCLTETDEATTPWIVTATYGYLRLRKTGYGPGELASLAARVRSEAWREAWCFFKHEDEARGPAFALALRELVQPERPQAT